jgi:predicted TIM-barrel fold metal-dependent hydrolase
MKYQVISGDSHIDLGWLPHDLFAANAPSKFQAKAPKVVEIDGRRVWQSDGVTLAAVAGLGFSGRDKPALGVAQHIDRMFGTGIFDDAASGTLRPTTANLRIKDQELDGVDAEVLYGILGVGQLLADQALVTFIFQTYNDWVANFCKENPTRFVGLACIPNHDPQLAAKELRRSAQIGLRGADFAVPTAVKPLYHRDWDVLWATAAECAMPISFHALGWSPRAPDPAEQQTYDACFKGVRRALAQISGIEFLPSIIFSGACDRFPKFKFVLGECGVSWIPYLLDRMDHDYKDRLHRVLNLSCSPRELWHRQGYSTYQTEASVPDVVHLVGEDNIIWGSDYPHPDGVWPDSKTVIAENLGTLNERIRRKIVCENAAKLYGFAN